MPIQSSDVFLKLADTVNQGVPAKRLVEYKLQQRPNGNPRYWGIVDFNQHSAKKRFYLFDTREEKVAQYYVAHGKGSEGESDDGMADVFSNVSGSNCSSLGIYLCLDEYTGKHGKSLHLEGLEPTNSNAQARSVVLHSADYVSDEFIDKYSRIGRSEGCLVVENAAVGDIVNELENGSFIVAWKMGQQPTSPSNVINPLEGSLQPNELPKGGGVSLETIEKIKEIASNSPVKKYQWKDRGSAPIGYIKGVAVTYAKSYYELKTKQKTAVDVMSQELGEPKKDALAFYEIATGSDVDRLRAVYTLALGLGMRESSGNTTEGRDITVTNPTETNAEAGLFQVSYDSFKVSPWLETLFNQYSSNKNQCSHSTFMEGVKDKKRDVVGSGKGAEFQKFIKECPSFATEYVMIMLRLNRTHFGPINTKKAEYNLDAERMFKDIEKIIDGTL